MRLCTCIVICLHLGLNGAMGTCLKPESYTHYGIGVRDIPVWRSRVPDYIECVRMCVRRSPCRSITYDNTRRWCELHRKLVSETQNITAPSLMYSEFSWMPLSIDEQCYARPCGQYEVCIPGTMAHVVGAAVGGNTGCSYTCMPVAQPVCPIPAVNHTGRTVASENHVICGHGYTGGGFAVCQQTLQWSNVIPPCRPIYNSTCGVNITVNCTEIDGICEAETSRCSCSDGAAYSPIELRCMKVLMCPVPPVLNSDRFVGSVNEVICSAGYSGGGEATCLPDLEWDVDIQPCLEIHNQSCVLWPPLCDGIQGVCDDQQKCACSIDSSVYNTTSAQCEPACPMPEALNGTRTPNSWNIVQCAPGEIGGGAAICLQDLTWTDDIQACQVVIDHPCIDDTICELVGATCTDGTCTCPDPYTYSSENGMCQYVCDASEPDVPTMQYYSVDVITRNYTCIEGYFAQLWGDRYVMVTCSQDGWLPEPKTLGCFTCGEPPQVPGASIQGSAEDRVRDYVCDAGLEPTGSEAEFIACMHVADDQGVWEPDIQCSGLRLVEGMEENNGYLQLYHEGWVNVCEDTDTPGSVWDWRETAVTCRDIAPLVFVHGGTIHATSDLALKPSPPTAVRLHNLTCDGREDSIMLCAFNNVVPITNNDCTLYITCYTEPQFSGDVYIQSSPTADINFVDVNMIEGRLLVVYQDVVGTVCADGWARVETNIACKSINNNWTGNMECEGSCMGYKDNNGLVLPRLTNNVVCDGTESHLRYCRNSGWYILGTSCDNEIKIKCNSS